MSSTSSHCLLTARFAGCLRSWPRHTLATFLEICTRDFTKTRSTTFISGSTMPRDRKHEARNKALVLEAFDALFNRRDFDAAERYWSLGYIQHSAGIGQG